MSRLPAAIALVAALIGPRGVRVTPSALVPGDDFEAEQAAFSIAFKEEVSAYREMTTFVPPGAPLAIEAIGPDGEYAMEASEGRLVRGGLRKWSWHAPSDTGKYDLRLKGPSRKDDTDTITLHVFVLVPASRIVRGFLNGYRIDEYPPKPANGNPMYRPPAGFIEVTKDNEDSKLTPHFRLKQFVCKQEPRGQYPKYVVLKERLLLELESILELVNRLGFDVDTLHVMSAYRTPYYNRVLRDATYSIHQFGGAADIFVDKDDKFRMDDLNRDGRIDVGDAGYLSGHIEQMLLRPPYKHFQGGIGVYPATKAHPPFVHVDVRGTPARWQG
jgi:hypothetical protein